MYSVLNGVVTQIEDYKIKELNQSISEPTAEDRISALEDLMNTLLGGERNE